ncbi:hypothetical protein Goari_003286 [Gossypium aridum]|uniref:Uncharacterized protein n=1 Tax=Gossypium aridum TaxID=34290 RepID=A0A7J8YBU3_GOSAI|nr:hypothetical protein [Gossypium aridum]
MTQLSGARSTTELIVYRAGFPWEARYAKSKRNPSLVFLFTPPYRYMEGSRGVKGDPINLFQLRIISSWDWSYFSIEKQKKASISKFNSDVACLFLDALCPIILNNACILCITAVAGTELADAYSPDTVNTSSPGKEAHNLDNLECQSHSI